MNKKPSLSSIQIALMAAGSALMFPYTFMPILRVPPQNQDVWIVFLLSFVYILIINAPLLYFANKFRGMNANEMSEAILGKTGGKIACSIFVLFAMFCFIACMILTTLFANIYIMQETPVWAILLLILIPVSFASLKGAGTLGRLSTFIIPFIIGTIIFFCGLGIEQMKFAAIMPILADSTLIELNKGAFLTACRFSEILIILIFSFNLKKQESINKTYVKALIIYLISMLLIIIPTLLVIGSDLGQVANNPYYLYTRQVGGYDFIQRVQSFNILAWFTGTILKLTIYNYMGSYVLAGIFKKKQQKSYVIPISIAGFILCQIPLLNKSSTIAVLSSDKVMPWIVFAVIFVVPFIMLIVYLIRKKKINVIIEQNNIEIKNDTNISPYTNKD